MTMRRSTLFVERGPGNRIALYINGDLQFDSTDERQYHELLVHPALAIARRSGTQGRILVLGGGDGLALREILRHDVAAVDLVDYDAGVVALARADFSALNAASFEDPRVRVQICDARDFVATAAGRRAYDVVICDLTVPTTTDECALYSIEWFAALRAILAPAGVLATNAVSPLRSPLAFWSIHNSARAAGLDVRPLRFALPSFIRQGYGEWGFLLAGATPLGDLETLALPLGTVVGAEAVRSALRLPRSSVALQAAAAPETAGSPILFHYLLNGATEAELGEPDDVLDFARAIELPAVTAVPSKTGTLARAIAECLPLRIDEPIDIERVVDQLPLQHRYQTRQMLRELSADWARYVRSLDVAALIEAILARVRELPERIGDELRDLLDRLRNGALDPERVLIWGGRVATVLIIVIILANTLMPDAAFAKGPTGGGPHFSAPHSLTTHSTPQALSHNLVADSRTPTTNRVSDYYGNYYPRGYYYYRPYYRRPPSSPQPGPSASPQPSPGQSATALVAGAYQVSADTTMLENGGLVVSLDQDRYLAIAADALLVMRQGVSEPVYALYRSPALITALSRELGDQIEGIRNYAEDLQTRRAGISLYARSAPQLSQLEQQLERSRLQLGTAGAEAPLPAGAREIFASAWALPTGEIALQVPDGTFSLLSGERLYATQQDLRSNTPSGQAPADLRAAVRSVLTQLVEADRAELAAIQADIERLSAEAAGGLRDLNVYLADQRDEGPGDLVEYGTDRMAVRDAIALTRSDLALIDRDLVQLFKDRDPLSAELTDLQRALGTVQ